VFKRLAIGTLACSLAACAALRPHAPAPAPPVPSQAAANLQALPGPGTYRIDSSSSELRLLVYRAGSLASLGHNHVMINRSVGGFVQVGATLSASSFSLDVPVDDFEIDDAQSRREEGSEFAGDIPEDAKSGTRRNMLSAAVLNAAEFPVLTVRSTALEGTPSILVADLAIDVAGHESRVAVPCSLQGDPHRFMASGSVELRQSSLGLTPYSLMRGALQVQDAMRLKFKIVVLVD
jgi:polyisoprenoid-binding protein YceI